MGEARDAGGAATGGPFEEVTGRTPRQSRLCWRQEEPPAVSAVEGENTGPLPGGTEFAGAGAGAAGVEDRGFSEKKPPLSLRIGATGLSIIDGSVGLGVGVGVALPSPLHIPKPCCILTRFCCWVQYGTSLKVEKERAQNVRGRRLPALTPTARISRIRTSFEMSQRLGIVTRFEAIRCVSSDKKA